MGYTTEFNGRFDLDFQLRPEHESYLRAFSSIRHMKRDSGVVEQMLDGLRETVELPVGVDGEHYVGSHNDGNFGQDRDGSILDYNSPPSTQPGLWCQWVPTRDGTGIEWDGNEKFYDYVEWLEYIVEHFLKPWGYVLNGKVEWRGEDWKDTGTISVIDNVVYAD